MKVIQTIQYGDNEPVESPYYKGDSHPKALAALVTAAATPDDAPHYNVLSVRIEF